MLKPPPLGSAGSSDPADGHRKVCLLPLTVKVTKTETGLREVDFGCVVMRVQQGQLSRSGEQLSVASPPPLTRAPVRFR
jgi:hypothetical protein